MSGLSSQEGPSGEGSKRLGIFRRLRERLASSTTSFRRNLTGLAAYGAIDAGFWEASEELQIWAGRVGAELVVGEAGSDPAAVAFNAVSAGVARSARAVIIDTAGRLHTRTGLMEELAKIRRSIGKALEGAPHETLLV